MLVAKIFKGIEYVQIGDMPSGEQVAIREWLTADIIIKIQTEKDLLTDCIQFKDYKYWFENILVNETSKELILKRKINSNKSFGFAIDK